MPPNIRGGPAEATHDKSAFNPPMDEFEMQSRTGEHNSARELLPTCNQSPETKSSGDTITCLNGLRGIACLLVFNYHFLWPWTAQIMLGHGAFPPRSPQPYVGWPFLPIICLLHRGRPMVAIFFAISGYVLCRHPLKAIHTRRIETAHKALASATFRRAFRLFIPPMLSMLLVAALAQMGGFRSEQDIYTGPDSKYINGSVTVGYTGRPCTNTTTNSTTAVEMAQYLGISSPNYLVNVTGNTTADWSQSNLCLNASSRLIMPSTLYGSMNSTEQVWWKIAMGMWISGPESRIIEEHEASVRRQAERAHNKTMTEQAANDRAHEAPPPPPPLEPPFIPRYNDWHWIQLGGSWEEHPIIHDKMSYAIGNLTTMYMEWANPFNFGLYFPRYDPHTFTIPLEFHGSIFIYAFLLATAALRFKWRLAIGIFLTTFSLRMGRWDMALFMGALLQSEHDIRSSSSSSQVDAGLSNRRLEFWDTGLGRKAMRWSCTALALHFLSYPDAGAEFTPGFMFLSQWVPRYYGALSGWMFYQAIGALMLLPCVLRSPMLRRLLDSPVPQYLGQISFSFYLVHGPLLHSLGFWIMPRLFDHVGYLPGLMMGYVMLLSISLYIADLWYEKIDLWSMTVGKALERCLSE